VESLSIKDYGFRMDYIENGCPAYSQCTRSKKGRILSRTTFAEYYKIIVELIKRRNTSIKDLIRPEIDHSKTLFPRLSVWNIKFPGLLIPA